MAPVSKSSGLAVEFLKFVDESPSPYHATDSVIKLLESANFTRIKESEDWTGLLKPNGRYFFTREGTSIVSFTLDKHFGQSELSFSIIGAHTDSPCFKIKPISKSNAHGYIQLGVECYGGGLWHTWFDRDLSVAGRVAFRKKEDNALAMGLVRIQRPILRIPNLAIHLQRGSLDGVKVNKEAHTTPIMATELAAVLTVPQTTRSVPDRSDEGATPKTNGTDFGKTNSVSESAHSRHPPLLLDIISLELGIDASQIVDLDVCVTDTQPAAIGGARNEFVFAPRLDNLASCFTATKALLNSVEETDGDENSELGSIVKMVTLFDHEEVGSSSSHGAGSPLVEDSIRRISTLCEGACYHRVIRNSMLVSADMAHALHPNYTSAHESHHRPRMGGGLVLKTNQNQRYATSGITGLIMREVARRGGNLPIQEFVVPNDKPCGSTIGPILSSITGLRTADVGQAQLSMHSVREMCSADDFDAAERMLRSYFKFFKVIDAELGESAE